MAKRRSAFAFCLFMVFMMVGCQAEGRTLRTTLQTDGTNPLPLVLTDETTVITGVAQAAIDPHATNDAVPVLQADPTDPNAWVLTWTGGECDTGATVHFRQWTDGYLLNVGADVGIGSCGAAAVERAIRIVTSRPIPAGSVTVAGG